VQQAFSIDLTRKLFDVRNVAKSTRLHAQAVYKAARLFIARRRNTAVGNDARFGKDSQTANQSGRPIIERLITGTELRVSEHAAADGEPTVICETQGAMSQQSNEAAHGHESVPQELLRLVGYRDPKTSSASAPKPRRNKIK
jgi:hypothetical protein